MPGWACACVHGPLSSSTPDAPRIARYVQMLRRSRTGTLTTLNKVKEILPHEAPTECKLAGLGADGAAHRMLSAYITHPSR